MSRQKPDDGRYVSFAKLNLFLYVVSRRNDGYHNLYSLMTRINLCDDIFLDFTAGGIQVSCSHPGVPEDESNLAAKAARLFFSALPKGRKPDQTGLSIKIIKRIPPGGGLGGGSSNAATVLAALNDHYGRPFTQIELMVLGLELGADVPFFIFKGPAIAKGVGDKLEKVERLMPYHLILCDPGVHAATGEVYKNIDFRLTQNQNYTMNTGLNALLRGQEIDVKGMLHNDLEAPACRLYPDIGKTKEEMAFLLDQEVYMTGSGSSLFALCSDYDAAVKGFETLSAEWKKSNRKVFLSSFR